MSSAAATSPSALRYSAKSRIARGEDPTAVLEALAQGLANKFLHHPTQALSHAGADEREALERAIEKLYPEFDSRSRDP